MRAVKKTVSFKKFYSVIRGDMGLTDRRRQASYDRADTMFLRCREGSQSLQGHAVHEGIMELNPVELGIWNGHGARDGIFIQCEYPKFDPLQYRPTHNKLMPKNERCYKREGAPAFQTQWVPGVFG